MSWRGSPWSRWPTSTSPPMLVFAWKLTGRGKNSSRPRVARGVPGSHQAPGSGSSARKSCLSAMDRTLGPRIDHSAGLHMANFWARDTLFYHIYPLGLCGAEPRNDGTSSPNPRLNQIRDWIGHLRWLGV